MAYVAQDDEEENQGQPQQGAEKVLGQESSIVGSGGASGGSAPATPKGTTSGSGWTNLTSYVKANEGADKTMGQAVQGKFNQRADQSQASVNTYGTGAEKTIADKTVTDKGVVSALSGIQPKEMKLPATSAPAGRTPKAVAPAATTPAKNTTRGGGTQAAAPAPAPAQTYTPDLVSSFTNQIAGYTGPNRQDEIEGYGTAASAVDQTGTNADMAQDFEGRRNYLREAYEDPKYTQGEQRLDSFITGAGTGGREALDAVNQTAEGQRTGWSDLVGRLGDGITTARTTSDKTKEDTLDAYRDASGRLDTAFADAEKTVTGHNTKNATAYKTALAAIDSDKPDKQAWGFQQAGVNPEVGAYLLSMGIPASQIIKQGGALGLGDIAGDDNKASYDFLSQLATAGQQSPLAARDFTKTGASGNAYDIDNDLVGTGTAAHQMETDFQNRLTKAQQARDFEADKIRAGVAGGIGADREKALTALKDKYGVDIEQILAINSGLGKGLEDYGDLGPMQFDPTQFIKSGTKLNQADVLSDADKKGWAELMKKLGTKGKVSTKDTQEEGDGWGFDKAGYDAAVAKILAERKRQDEMIFARKKAG